VHLPLDSSEAVLQDAKKRIEDAGLALMACGVIRFTKHEKTARQAFDFARVLGLPVLAANPEAASFDLLDKLVEEYGIRIAIHNHGPDGAFSVPQDLLKAVKDHHERIGACVDIGHYERSDVNAADALLALRHRLYDVHLKDVNLRAKSGHSVVLGEGVIDLPAVVRTLVELRYEGHVGLEYEEEAESPQQSMAKSLDHFRKLAAEAVKS